MNKAPQKVSSSSDLKAIHHRRSLLIFTITVLVLLSADLLVKRLAFEHVAGAPIVLDAGDGAIRIPRHDSIPVLPGILSLHLTLNEGAVFGLGEGGRWIFIAFSIVAAVVIASIFARSAAGRIVLHLALAGVLAGALGNLYDRLRFGKVRDMLHLFPEVSLPFGLRWPNGSGEVYPWIFNIADVCLVVGLLVLLVLLYREDKVRAGDAEMGKGGDGEKGRRD